MLKLFSLLGLILPLISMFSIRITETKLLWLNLFLYIALIPKAYLLTKLYGSMIDNARELLLLSASFTLLGLVYVLMSTKGIIWSRYLVVFIIHALSFIPAYIDVERRWYIEMKEEEENNIEEGC